METKQHTPGEWNYSKTVNDYSIYSDSNSKDIAAVYQYSRNIPEEEAKANVLLITAAPDLLQAAHAAAVRLESGTREEIEFNKGIATLLRQAINKATNQ